MITIFTPTYNRAYLLPKLYESLCNQTCKDFEWLVVDDGSTDDTNKLFEDWISMSKISIRYIYQQNGGKHRAINRGVKEAIGNLFFIVDSDDYLRCDAIEIILHNFYSVEKDDSVGGVSGMRVYPDGKRIGGETFFDKIICTFYELRYKHHVHGDLAEVYRTSVMQEFPFPEINGERFCPEEYVWAQISRKYKVLFFNKKIYVCDYLDDGLTASITRIRINSPIGTTRTYEEICKSHSQLSVSYHIKSAINFWRFWLRIPNKRKMTYNYPMKLLTPMLLLCGLCMYIKDRNI